MKPEDVEKMKTIALKDYLEKLLKKLDELDQDDFFGTEGWRHFIMGED